ncbi:hypothetical protein Tco_1517695 [Tanacetum coccineum]
MLAQHPAAATSSASAENIATDCFLFAHQSEYPFRDKRDLDVRSINMKSEEVLRRLGSIFTSVLCSGTETEEGLWKELQFSLVDNSKLNVGLENEIEFLKFMLGNSNVLKLLIVTCGTLLKELDEEELFYAELTALPRSSRDSRIHFFGTCA